MKKLLCILCLLLALVCVLAACDKTETPNTGGDTPNTEQNGGDNNQGGGDNQTSHTHAYGDWSVITAATCGTKGEEKRTCSCGASETREIAATGEHTYGAWNVTTAATCTAKGEEKRTCTGCTTPETREIAATGAHNYVQGVCSCGAKEYEAAPLYTREGDKIYFGSYPQSEVTDATLISTLNTKAGELPTSADAKKWTSYGYYLENKVQDYMWYIDIKEADEKYRGVYFESYRVFWPTDPSSAELSDQDNNGYYTGIVYWFKYEPISWTVLKEENDLAFLLCDMILDAQPYQNEVTNEEGTYNWLAASNGTPDGTYANNYEYSAIRSWLNNNFYRTAFQEMQQQIILTTTVSNDPSSIGGLDGGTPTVFYPCNDTQDKIFLLSVKEVTSEDYGFAKTTSKTETREKKTTDYAQAQGAYNEGNGNGTWWLRSPLDYCTSYARSIYCDGDTLNYGHVMTRNYSVKDPSFGVVPALQIQLNDDEHQHSYGDWQVVSEATCSSKGEEKRTCTCGKSETREIAKNMDNHSAWGTWGVTTPATCGTTGVETRTCACGESETREVAATGVHVSTRELKCGRCGERMLYHREEGYIYFGEYPQTLKADDVTITATTDSRGYYLGSDNAYYAKVTATPYDSGYTFSDGSAVTDGTVYYFKVEPILWRILSQSDDTALILCDSIIANKAYQSSYQYSNGEYYTTANGAPSGTYANNYQYSEVRAWLNAEFYNAAFSALQQELILTTTVDNSTSTTGYDPNPYICESTRDKVFLLSYADATNNYYGFSSDFMAYDAARIKKPSDYSRAVGAWVGTAYGNGYWRLRSPCNVKSYFARGVSGGGYVNGGCVYGIDLYYDSNGIVPALQIRLN